MELGLTQLKELPIWAVDLILSTANFITGGKVGPGIISSLLILALICFCVRYAYITKRFRSEISTVQKIIDNKDGEQIDEQRLIDIEEKFIQLGERKGFERGLSIAWKEFKETTIAPNDERQTPLRNTVRPSSFFNREDIGLEHGIWRQIPALFVSIGLFFTFLGLVAALDQTGVILDQPLVDNASSTLDTLQDDDSNVVKGLRNLLTIASAKFIMSLTGLFCSIFFTIFIKIFLNKIDKALQNFCETIEKGCEFQTEQAILDDLLDYSIQQTEHLKTFSTELVAQIAIPLKEDLPNAIRDILSPALEKLSHTTNQGVENLVDSVAGKLAGNIDESTRALEDKIENILEVMSKTTEQFNDSMQNEVLSPLSSLTVQIDTLVNKIENSTEHIESFGESIENTKEAYEQASAQIKQTLTSLTSAAEPIRSMVEQIDSASRSSANRIELASETMLNGVREITKSTESALNEISKGMKASQITVQQGLDSLNSAVQRFNEIAGKFDEIDETLGEAFEDIVSNVQANIREFKQFQKRLNEELGGSLTRLESIIAKAEPFKPRNNEP